MSELYALPEGWEWKKLGDPEVCQLIMGQSPKSDTYNTEGIGMPFFQGKTEFGEMYPTVSKYCTAPKKIANVGDILLSVRAPVGPTNIANIDCCIGRGLGAIRPNKSNTLTNYLLYFFRNFELEISQKGKGSTFSAITKKELENTNIPLPPLQEQKRIVAKLDSLFAKIDHAIALHQQNIDEAEGFMGSVLNEVFGDLEEEYGLVNFSSIIENKIQNGLYKHKDSYNNNGIRILRINNFYNGEINDFGIKRLSLTDEELAKYRLEENDIVINRVNSMKYLGKSAFIHKLSEPMVFESNMMRISISEEKEPRYIVYMLQTKNIKNQISNKAKRAVNQCSINQTDVKSLTIPLPPLNIQQKTIQYLDQLSQKTQALKEAQQEKMAQLKALKASLLDRAFRGEL